jgi:hypothetical protein
MRGSQQRSRYEEALARSHRALYWATKRAEEVGDEGAVQMLHTAQTTVAELMEMSLRNKRAPRIPGETQLPF